MKCVFLDRDGTLIRHVHYLHDPQQVELLPTVIPGLELLKSRGCVLILHSNQAGVGRGFFPMSDAIDCTNAMIGQIGLGADLFAEICLSPESPDQPVLYRKPSPRFAREVMQRRNLRAADLVYIGDNVTDLETAHNVGCAAIGLTTGVHGLRELAIERGLTKYPVLDTFLAAANLVVGEAAGSHAPA